MEEKENSRPQVLQIRMYGKQRVRGICKLVEEDNCNVKGRSMRIKKLSARYDVLYVKPCI